MNLYQKLAKVRVDIGITKTGNNAFGKYDFYQIDNIYAKCKQEFLDIGLATFINTKVHEIGGEPMIDYILTVVNTEEPTERENFSLSTRMNSMKGAQDAQETGATTTYMAKYLYGLALFIDDGKSDPDANNKHDKTIDKVKKILSRTEALKKFEGLDPDKQEGYLKDYSKREGKTVSSHKFIKKYFLDELVITEKW